jgi:geranylgeranyl pyrophosphate synthase
MSSLPKAHISSIGPISESIRLLDLYKQQVESSIDKHLKERAISNSILSQAYRLALSGPGKRFRAMLALASCDAVSGDRNKASRVALAIEMIHTHSLILDDLPCMDDDSTRRGRPSLHKQFDQSTALLAASTLLTEAMSQLALDVDAHTEKRCKLIADACGLDGIAQGQWDDLNGIASLTQTKTAPLLSAALAAGALCAANVTPFAIERFKRFGTLLGAAYQYRDDAMDDTAQQKQHQIQAEKLADQAIITLSHAGLDTPALRKLTELAISRKI